MKTPTPKWRIVGVLVLLLATCVAVRAATENWRYEILAQDKVIKADAIKSKTGENLLEFKSIDVGGFKTGRLFVQVMQSDFYKNQGKFTRDAKLRVTCFHKTKSGSSHYFEKEVPMGGSGPGVPERVVLAAVPGGRLWLILGSLNH